MKPLLLLDIGNTRVKWALVQPGASPLEPAQWLAEGVCTHDRIDVLLREWERQPVPDRVFGANVAGEAAAGPIEAYWRQRQVQPVWARPQPECCGVKNAYDQPDQLGIDRWAALVGAWNRQHGACLVVSAGTALTIDTLDAHGVFQGGMILPGKHLMQQSLIAGTHALTGLPGHISHAPKNTADAIASGIAAALAAPVQEAYARLASVCTAPPACLPVCILTGGDAEWLASQLAIRCTIAPRIILEGLLEMALEETQT